MTQAAPATQGAPGAQGSPGSLAALGARDGRPAVLEPGRGALSYEALDALADRVARRLRERGVAPGARVGLYLPRSADAIAALLGVLRAGCAYVPLDPRAPALRNVEILESCGVALALVEERFAAACAEALRGRDAPRTPRIEVVGAAGLGRGLAAWAEGGPAGAAMTAATTAAAAADGAPGDALACILYTSGSTGEHKGWRMSRAAVLAHARWVRGFLGVTREDVLANHAQLSFGMSLFDVFTSLGAGATLVLVPEELRAQAAPLVEMLARERVTVWFSGPAILSRMAALPDLERHDLSALRFLAFAGEVFPAAPLAALRRRLPGPRFFNLYGSTETNVAAYHEVPAGAEVLEPAPIGRTCAHYEARIVTDPAIDPSGAVGELQLRGAGLESGYLGRPDLDAERLLPAADGGAPWFRTCDLVARLPSGALRFAGRLGRMVKVNGHRVEPGEVEARLREHPAVAEAAVVPEEGPLGTSLVAHVGGPRLSVVALKEHCAARLPAYMIPARFVFHEALPRNLRGKVDLAGLRALGEGPAGAGAPPQTGAAPPLPPAPPRNADSARASSDHALPPS